MNKPKLDIEEVSQTIDLEELTGIDLSGHRDLRESIGQAMLDRISERTANMIDINGKGFKAPYSEEYQDTLEFKAAGKSPGRINLYLTGDMLGTMQVDASTDSLVKIAVAKDQAPKAYNHCVGETVPRRNFFGVTKRDVTKILADFADDIDAVRSDERQQDADTPDKLRLIDLLDFDDEELDD